MTTFHAKDISIFETFSIKTFLPFLRRFSCDDFKKNESIIIEKTTTDYGGRMGIGASSGFVIISISKNSSTKFIQSWYSMNIEGWGRKIEKVRKSEENIFHANSTRGSFTINFYIVAKFIRFIWMNYWLKSAKLKPETRSGQGVYLPTCRSPAHRLFVALREFQQVSFPLFWKRKWKTELFLFF